jgi:hypothetical protein
MCQPAVKIILALAVPATFSYSKGAMMLKRQKLVYLKPRLVDDSSHSAFRQVPRMVWNSSACSGGGIPPDLVASFGLAVKDEACPPQFVNYFTCTEAR